MSKPKNKPNKSTPSAAETPLGVVGQGVMGATIAAGLLAAGHPVTALAPTTLASSADEYKTARRRVRAHLKELHKAGVLREAPNEVLSRFEVTREYSDLADCQLVVESIIEDLAAKREVIRQVEAVVSARALIGSNTSALLITLIQEGAKRSGRVLGMHWLSSSPFGECVEVMGGEQTTKAAARRAYELVQSWGKTATLVKEDVRGFLANRIFYAMLREAFALLESGAGSAEEIDAAMSASLGTWLPHAGPFRYLDLSGLPAYPAIMRDILPDLNCAQNAPETLQKLVDSGAEGIGSRCGFYEYSPEEAK